MKRRKSKQSKPIKKQLFFITVPLYEREVCAVVGMSHEEAVRAAKKQKCTKEFIKALHWESAVELCDKVNKKEVDGAAVRVNEHSYFLFLRSYRNDWKYLDTLLHECFHMTQFISTVLTIWDDKEAPAYLHTWLFKKLRRVLSGNET